ncbi:hypothetical protein ACFLSJ_05555, partial [Verrucomicrobiota bacterium]
MKGRPRVRVYRRTLSRVAVLVVAAVFASGLLPGEYSVILPAVSSHLALCAALAGLAVAGPLLLLGLPVVLASLWNRRWFCR